MGIFLFSCEQEDLSVINEKGVESSSVETKATISVPSLIEQIDGMPVNFILSDGVNHSNRYLSASSKNRYVELASGDDKSGRQQWIIKKRSVPGSPFVVRSISAAGGVYNNLKYLSFTQENNKNMAVLLPSNGEMASTWSVFGLNNPSLYSILVGYMLNSLTLCAESRDGRRVVLEEATSPPGHDRGRWEISPVEDLELIDVKYSYVSTDKFQLKPLFLERRVFNNLSAVEDKDNITITQTVSESSTFSKVEGLTLTNKISSSINVGLPLISGGNINVDQTTAKTWNYTESHTETKTRQITDTYSLSIPAYSKVTLEIYAVSYEMDLTYIAILRNLSHTRTLTVRGRWSGLQVTELSYNKVITGPDGSVRVEEIPGVSNISPLKTK